MDKVVTSATRAVADTPRGATVVAGGFGLCGVPAVPIEALLDAGVDDLEVVSKNAGVDDWVPGRLLAARRLHVPDDVELALQSENGIVGFRAAPLDGDEDPDLIDAGKETVTVRRGASLFASATSFGMVHGGKVDVGILGAMQVSAGGDTANWTRPGKMIEGMGDAMDLVHGAKRVIVLMEHVARDGTAKILEERSLPCTGRRVVHRVITDLAVLDVSPTGLHLVERAPEVTEEEVLARTGVPVHLLAEQRPATDQSQ